MYLIPGKHPNHQRAGIVAIAACVVDLNGHVPAEIQLTPAGQFRARDGRPEGLHGWYIDADIAARVIARAQATAGDFVIDYEHQTLHAEKNGQPAPAGGWWQGANMEWRDGEGLFATDITWTDNARAVIAAREYRYISPVLAYDKTTGHVLAILMAALTNYPAIEGLSDLTAMAAAKFDFTSHHQQETDTVKREQLIKLLGLAEDASDEQIQAGMEALKARADLMSEVRTSLGIDEQASVSEAIATLKTNADSNEPDPAKYVPIDSMKALQTEVASLTVRLNGKEVDDLVDLAMSEGKLLPAQEAWARELGGKDIDALKGYLDSAQPIAALKGKQTGGKAPEGGVTDGELGEEAIAICKQMGIDPEEYKKTAAASA
ncbi:MAG: phage protease [Chromatiales bacterium]|nr:phage protease [Chromatiales bacterium]